MKKFSTVTLLALLSASKASPLEKRQDGAAAAPKAAPKAAPNAMSGLSGMLGNFLNGD